MKNELKKPTREKIPLTPKIDAHPFNCYNHLHLSGPLTLGGHATNDLQGYITQLHDTIIIIQRHV